MGTLYTSHTEICPRSCSEVMLSSYHYRCHAVILLLQMSCCYYITTKAITLEVMLSVYYYRGHVVFRSRVMLLKPDIYIVFTLPFIHLISDSSSYFNPIVLTIFSYTVHARAAIRVLLNILGARPVTNPLGPCCPYILLTVMTSPLFSLSSCMLVLMTSAG